MKLSTFFNEKDNDPKLIEASWEGLEDSFREVRKCQCSIATCARSDCAGKLGTAWSPAWWAEGDTRRAATTKEVCAFVIDFDKLTNLDLLQKLEDYKLLIHSSHSDNPEARCLRVIVAMSAPVPGHMWPLFWDAVMKHLDMPLGPGGADRQCRDSSRLFFAPSRPFDACHPADDGSGYLFESRDGKALDVEYILANVEEPEETVYSPPASFRGAPSPEDWETAVEALAGGWPDSGRNSAQLALCGALAHAGWPPDLIADFVYEVCERAHPGNGDRRKRLKSAKYSVDKIARGEPVTGWPGVIEHVDPEVVGVATTALNIGPQKDDGFAKAFSFLTETNKVVVTRDDIELTLKGARNKLNKSSSLPKQKEALYIGRALKGESFSNHADEDQNKATADAIYAVAKNAPRGTPALLLAEYLTRSRPDIEIDDLCKMVEIARERITDETKGSAPLDEFVIDFKTGKPSASSLHNFDVALSRMNVTFYYDEFSRREIIEVVDGDHLHREVVEDRHIEDMMINIDRRYGFYPAKDKFISNCGFLARQNSFHPVRDYLDSLPDWDGVPRVETWLIDFAGVEDTPYVRAVSRIVLTAAIRRVRQPGVKFDEMLILEGGQGSGKSTTVKALCPEGEWFSDNFNLEGDSKRMIEQTSGKWIIEAGELRGMSVKDHNALKQYLSSTHDEARMAYARKATRQAREFIIIGTTNDSQYLRDHTGDRRYWPVKTGIFNVPGLLEVREQLWAEASYLEYLNRYDKDYIRLHPSLWGAAAAEQSKRKVDNAVKIKLEDFLSGHTGRILPSDVWRLLTDDHVPQQGLVMQASNAMQELGWEKGRYQLNGKRQNYYVKGSDEDRANKQLIVTGNLNFGLAVKSVNIDENGNPILDQPLAGVRAN